MKIFLSWSGYSVQLVRGPAGWVAILGDVPPGMVVAGAIENLEWPQVGGTYWRTHQQAQALTSYDRAKAAGRAFVAASHA